MSRRSLKFKCGHWAEIQYNYVEIDEGETVKSKRSWGWSCIKSPPRKAKIEISGGTKDMAKCPECIEKDKAQEKATGTGRTVTAEVREWDKWKREYGAGEAEIRRHKKAIWICRSCRHEKRRIDQYQRDASSGPCCARGIDEFEMWQRQRFTRTSHTGSPRVPIQTWESSVQANWETDDLRRAKFEASEAARRNGWQPNDSSLDPEAVRTFVGMTGTDVRSLPHPPTPEPPYQGHYLQLHLQDERWNENRRTGHGTYPGPDPPPGDPLPTRPLRVKSANVRSSGPRLRESPRNFSVPRMPQPPVRTSSIQPHTRSSSSTRHTSASSPSRRPAQSTPTRYQDDELYLPTKPYLSTESQGPSDPSRMDASRKRSYPPRSLRPMSPLTPSRKPVPSGTQRHKHLPSRSFAAPTPQRQGQIPRKPATVSGPSKPPPPTRTRPSGRRTSLTSSRGPPVPTCHQPWLDQVEVDENGVSPISDSPSQGAVWNPSPVSAHSNTRFPPLPRSPPPPARLRTANSFMMSEIDDVMADTAVAFGSNRYEIEEQSVSSSRSRHTQRPDR
jgi:hypothetical protein